MEALSRVEPLDAFVEREPAPRPARRKSFLAALIAAAILALGGAGYAGAQMPGGSGSPGAGFSSHCH